MKLKFKVYVQIYCATTILLFATAYLIIAILLEKIIRFIRATRRQLK